jgi:hypothetical protein
MAKGKAATATGRAPRGIRIVGFDPLLHRGIRAVAAERGVPAYRLYEEIVRALLADARRKPAA